MITRRYTFKMYPNSGQKAALENMRVMCCRLYNALNEQRHDRWSRFGRAMSAYDQGPEMTRMCNDPELPEWRGFPAGVRERVAARIDQAWKKYFSNLKDWRKGKMDRFPLPPRYQKTEFFNGFGLRESGKNWKFLGKKIRMTKVGDIKIRGRFPLKPEQIRTADLMLKKGRWYISIVVKMTDFRRMSRPQQQNFRPAVVNSLNKIMEMLEVSCSGSVFDGERQDSAVNDADIVACSGSVFDGERQAPTLIYSAHVTCSGSVFDGERQDLETRTDRRLSCSVPGFDWERQARRTIYNREKACSGPGFSGERHGRTSPSKSKQKERLDYAMHYITSWIAETCGDICITRPHLKAATKSAKGTKSDPGGMVKFKARQTRKLLDLNIGKFCALLEYKVEARGNKFEVIETKDHRAMIPAEISALAKAGKKAKRKAA